MVTTATPAIHSGMPREETAKALRELARLNGQAAARGTRYGSYDRKHTGFRRRTAGQLHTYADAYERGDEAIIAEFEAMLAEAEQAEVAR